MSAIDGKQIAIIGAGPGGLTLARLLQQCGARVRVYERDHSPQCARSGQRVWTCMKIRAWRRWKRPG